MLSTLNLNIDNIGFLYIGDLVQTSGDLYFWLSNQPKARTLLAHWTQPDHLSSPIYIDSSHVVRGRALNKIIGDVAVVDRFAVAFRDVEDHVEPTL